MIKTRPQKTKTTSQLIKELDDVFSDFIRLRWADHRGNVKCFITGLNTYWKAMDAAHFCNRQHMGTRWDEQNVHATTIDSNRFDEMHDIQYEQKMIETYGIDLVTEIVARSRSMVKFTAFELQEKIAHYSEEVKKLRALKKI